MFKKTFILAMIIATNIFPLEGVVRKVQFKPKGFLSNSEIFIALETKSGVVPVTACGSIAVEMWTISEGDSLYINNNQMDLFKTKYFVWSSDEIRVVRKSVE